MATRVGGASTLLRPTHFRSSSACGIKNHTSSSAKQCVTKPGLQYSTVLSKIRRSCKSVHRMSSSDTTAVTRPLHQVNRLRKSTRSNPERRYSRRSPRLQYASHSGFATHKPVVLKEGYLNKPSFFRFVSTS